MNGRATMAILVLATAMASAVVLLLVARLRRRGRPIPDIDEEGAELVRRRRREDVIRRRLAQLVPTGGRYYVQDEVRDCLREILTREGRPDLAPGPDEYLRYWRRKAGIPREVRELARQLEARIRSRLHELAEMRARVVTSQPRLQRRSEAEEVRRLFAKHRDLLDAFLESAERQVSVTDANGYENWEALQPEIVRLVSAIAGREGLPRQLVAEVLREDTPEVRSFAVGWDANIDPAWRSRIVSLAGHAGQEFRHHHQRARRGTDAGR